jgi:hypothetical protein
MMLSRSFPGSGTRPPEVFCLRFGGCTGLYVGVRRIGGADGPAYVHRADSVAAANLNRSRLRRSEMVCRCRRERSVKPSAQPALVRAQQRTESG